MNCVILGDKYQKGMKSKGCSALINITKKTNNIQQQYDILVSMFKNITITYVYGFDNKKFVDFYNQSKLQLDIVYNSKYSIHNQAFSLSLIKDILDRDETLILDGYTCLNKGVFKKFDPKKGSQVFLDSKNSKTENSIGCIINNNKIENFSFDLDNNIQQIYYLDKEASGNLKKILEDRRHSNCFIFELLNKLIDNGHTIIPQKI